MQVKRVLACRNDLGEGPLWSTRDKTLHWLDINQSKIHCYHPASGKQKTYDMPIKVTALAQRRMGGFICATEKGFQFWNGTSPELRLISHPEEGKEGARFQRRQGGSPGPLLGRHDGPAHCQQRALPSEFRLQRAAHVGRYHDLKRYRLEPG